ncbi:ketoacyl-synt-domain-containing protein, partial [Mycena floridula]
MNTDLVSIIGTAFRLPGQTNDMDQLWRVVSAVDAPSLSSPPPNTSRFMDIQALDHSSASLLSSKAGWISEQGVETFDAAFFNISPAEAQTLRPNIRLGLELTWEALENAGIPPSSIRGRSVSVSIAVGTEDGWDTRQFCERGPAAFNHYWAASSDPSGISGRISHYFDFRGPSVVNSAGCCAAAFALRDAVHSLNHEECEIAIVGALTTHLFCAPFEWASQAGVASQSGRCAAFSPAADGYMPSEGAVFFILKKNTSLITETSHTMGVIRSIVTGHNGATKTLAAPSVDAQVSITQRSLASARIKPEEIVMIEAHGTGTRLGDEVELEAIRLAYKSRLPEYPLYVSTAKTIFGHCQAASAFVGILKVLACFKYRQLPPHHVTPHTNLTMGNVQVPTSMVPVSKDTAFLCQVSSFGVTGSIASMILEAPATTPVPIIVSDPGHYYLLPFSAKSIDSLHSMLVRIRAWSQLYTCPLPILAAMLSLTREHHPQCRLAIIAHDISDLDFYANLAGLGRPITATTSHLLDHFPNDLEQAKTLFEAGHNLNFREMFSHSTIPAKFMETFPTYPFDRQRFWNESSTQFWSPVTDYARVPVTHHGSTVEKVTAILCEICRVPNSAVNTSSNIFDLGLDSLSIIDFAANLSRVFDRQVPIVRLYLLLTAGGIAAWLDGSITPEVDTDVDSQQDLDAWIERYGERLQGGEMQKISAKSDFRTVLLTGANGSLGSYLLKEMLHRTEDHVVCLIRGSATTAFNRLQQTFRDNDFDLSQLDFAMKSGRLLVIAISDLSDTYLGCSLDEYQLLLNKVELVIHGAWRLDFNLPVGGFLPSLQATRNIAQLCHDARGLVRLMFLSSYSTTFKWPEVSVPEILLPPKMVYSLKQGYALSKLIAENSLRRMLDHSPQSFQLSIARIGQICGASDTNKWSSSELMPMIIAAIPSLRAVPDRVPDLSWIPLDVCANTLIDINLIPPGELASVDVYNIANPTICSWPDSAKEIGNYAGVNDLAIVSFEEYIQLVRNSTPRPAVSRLLPYFIKTIDQGGFPVSYAKLDTDRTLARSESLASCPVMTGKTLARLVTAILHPSEGIITPVWQSVPAVLVFGTWIRHQEGNQMDSDSIVHKRLRVLGIEARKRLGYTLSNIYLDDQLSTLASQLLMMEELDTRQVKPLAVVGYSFGEFAAAVTARVMSEDMAVEIITRRAAAIQLQGLDGGMISIFTSLIHVQEVLAGIECPPDVAIIAGPNHVVLSGLKAQIDITESIFHSLNIKFIRISSTLPYHSSVLAPCGPALCVTSVTEVTASDTVYISGVTGTALRRKRHLDSNYWIRHMTETARFLSCMEYVHKNYANVPVIDVGPGDAMKKIISRYAWSDMRVVGPLDDIAAGPSTTPATSPIPEVSMIPVARLSITTALETAASIFTDLFHFDTCPDLHRATFDALGIQSLDFTRFTDEFLRRTGTSIPASSFYIEGSTVAAIISK